MLFLEPDVDCLRLQLRDIRIPTVVLAQKPDAVAATTATPSTVTTEAQTTKAPLLPHLPRSTAVPAQRQQQQQQPFPVPTAAEPSSPRPASGAVDAVSSATLSPLPSNRPSATVSASTRTTASAAASSDGAHINLEERADALHRALLSALYDRFPYELRDTLEYAYVLVITHHAAPSISSQPFTAEELSYLTAHNGFLPTELRCRTFPSHLNAALDPACTAASAVATVAAAAAPSSSPAPSQQATQRRPSIRVTDDAAQVRQADVQRSAHNAAAAVLRDVPMAPRFYDSFFLLARDLTPAQQALYYETRCRRQAVPAEERQSSQPTFSRASATPGSKRAGRTGRRTAATAGEGETERFQVLQGHFTHFIPVREESASAGHDAFALAAAAQRMSGARSGYRRVVGESEEYDVSPNNRAYTTDAAGAPTAAKAVADDVCALHFSVYRIPLTRFEPEDQQYYTDQREELRWLQRRRCCASYRTRRREERRRRTRLGTGNEVLAGTGKPSWWPFSRSSAAEVPPLLTPDVQKRSSCSSSSSSSSVSSNFSSCSSSDVEDEEEDEVAALGDGITWRRCREIDSVMDQLFSSEVSAATATSALTGPENYTPAEQRRATRFFERCHKVLTNYAFAHSSLASEEDHADESPAADPTELLSSTPALQPHGLHFPGVSYFGVSRLLYSFAPCDCYHLVMRDKNPLYYAHSSRASYQPQTVPLCLVSDLTHDSPRATAAAARITANSTQTRATQLRRAASNAHGEQVYDDDETAGSAKRSAANAGRPSPGPDISGKVLWLDNPAAPAATGSLKDSVEGSMAALQDCAGGPVPLSRPAQSSRASSGCEAAAALRQSQTMTEGGLVRSRRPSRAPSPERADSSWRLSAHAKRGSQQGKPATASSAACTEGVLRITASLLSNSISGNPRRTEKSLTEKGARVPDFLLPDAARRGSGIRNHGDVVAVSPSEAPSSAVVNLFRALAESSLAQHKLRYGAIRSVISVAVLESTHDLAGGAGTQRYGTPEATTMRQSTRYCCRGLIDHAWVSMPVQCTPAEQEAIQWMPVMLGSTECVSDVGLRTAVHLGVFPLSASGGDSSRNSGGDGVMSEDAKGGVWPTREGAVSSLKPSLTPSTAQTHVAAGVPGKSTPVHPGVETSESKNASPQPLQPRVVNSATVPVTKAAAPPAQQPPGSYENQPASSSPQHLSHETADFSASAARLARMLQPSDVQQCSTPPRSPPPPQQQQEEESQVLGRHREEVEVDVSVDRDDEEAPPRTTVTSMRAARGGVAMTFDVGAALTGRPKAPGSIPATTAARMSMTYGGAEDDQGFENANDPRRAFCVSSVRDSRDADYVGGGGAPQQERKAIRWPDKPLPSVDPRAYRIPSPSSPWTSLSATRGVHEGSVQPHVSGARGRQSEVETIEMVEDNVDDAEGFTSVYSDKESYEGCGGQYENDTKSFKEEREVDQARERETERRRAPGTTELFKATATSTTPAAARVAATTLPNPFYTHAQGTYTTPSTPPRTPRGPPASFSALTAPAPTVPSRLRPSPQDERFFDNPLSSADPSPRRAVEPTFFDQPAEPKIDANAGPRIEERAARWPPSQPPQPCLASTPRHRSTAATSLSLAALADQRGASRLSDAVTANSLSGSMKDWSQNVRGGAMTDQTRRQTTDLDAAECFDSPEGRPGRGAVGECPLNSTADTTIAQNPSTYFESMWGAQKAAHASADPLLGSTRQNTWVSRPPSGWPTSPHSQQQQQQQRPFFPDAFGRQGTTPFASQRAQVRKTLGMGLSAGGAASAASAAAPGSAARHLSHTLCIDEYDDDAAMKAPAMNRATALRSRVRPRGVSATDAVWWQPVRELSSAPNLRFSSAWPQSRATTTTTRATTLPLSSSLGVGTMSRPSVSMRLSTSADQPYNVSFAEFNFGESAHLRKELHSTPREHSARPTSSVPSFTATSRWTTNRPSLNVEHTYNDEAKDYLCRAHEPFTQEFSPSSLHSHLQEPTRSSALLGRCPPLAPSFRNASSHRYSTAAATTPTTASSRTPCCHAYSTSADRVEAERHRRALRRQQRLNNYQQHLQENYMCGPMPKRFCFERPPLHPVSATSDTRDAPTGGIQVLGHVFGDAASGAALPRNGTLATQHRFAHAATQAAAAAASPVSSGAWTPRTTASPSCLPPFSGLHSDEKATSAACANTPLSDAARAFSLGVHPALTAGGGGGRGVSYGAQQDGRGNETSDVPVLFRGGHNAEQAAQAAETRLREQQEQQACMTARRQMKQLDDAEAAARLSSGVNVSFTLRDIAAVFLRLPSTTMRASRRSAADSRAVCSDGDTGLEVLDICKAAALRTEGVSCIISRKPTQMRGGWESYKERLNLYQEPFYLRDQAFILLLPVPHVPELKVCVAIHNVNDVVALVCQTPVPRILPTEEEEWMRQRRYGWGSDEENDECDKAGDDASGGRPQRAPGKSNNGLSTVTIEERRWFFGLFRSRRVVQESGGSGNCGGNGVFRTSAVASWRQRQQQQSAAPANEDAARRATCRALRRQHHAEGLCLTWRHRMHIWYALFQAGRSCMSLSACTSPLLTDPAACQARCALLCDRVAAYAAVCHRLETLQAIRQAYIERRAEELSRQRVLKLCDAPYLKSRIRLGESEGEAAAMTKNSRSAGGEKHMRDEWQPYSPGQPLLSTLRGATQSEAHAKRSCVASTVSDRPSSTWSELHGAHTQPPAAAFTRLATSHGNYGSREVGGSRYERDAANDRHRAESPAPPTSHFDQPKQTTQGRYTTAALRVPSARPGTTRAMQLRCDASRRVAQGEAPVSSLRHATRLFAFSGDDRVDAGVSNSGGSGAIADAVSAAAPTSGSYLFPAAAVSSVAPYASSVSIAPSRHISTQQQQQQQQQLDEGRAVLAASGSTPASRLALSAAAASTHMDLILHLDRDDTVARALNHLAQVRATSIVPPLTTVLSAVPRSTQLVRGAGGGIREDSNVLPATAESRDGPSSSSTPEATTVTDTAPLYAGFVPSPVELQRRLTPQPFDISLGQVQQLLQWQWEHHQHSYTLMPLPLFRGAVGPSVDFSLFASTRTTEQCGAGKANAAASPTYAVSPLARELILQLVHWSWLLLPVDYSCRRRGNSHAPRAGSSAFFPRGARGRSWRLRRWRLLFWLTAFTVVAQHPAGCFTLMLGIAALRLAYNGLTVGLIARLPSHRRSRDGAQLHDMACQREWRPRLLLLCGPRIRLPRLFHFGFARHHRKHQHCYCSSHPPSFATHPFLTLLARNVPPLRERVSLLYNLSEATAQSWLERRREHFSAQTVVTYVLRCQTCTAAVLSRLQLALCGYSTTFSLWASLLCLAYLLLYLVYVSVVGQLWRSSASAYSGAASQFTSSALNSSVEVMASLLRHYWVTISASTSPAGGGSWSSGSGKPSPLDLLRDLSASVWKGVVEPVRFLQQQQRAQAAATVPAEADAEVDSASRSEAADAGRGRSPYFYQNGRYYDYDATPTPAWATPQRTLLESAPTQPTASAGSTTTASFSDNYSSMPLNNTRQGEPIHLRENAEVNLLWFFVFAYFATFCLPRSPFRWLWRRVWSVLTHDDALARRPLLTV